LRGTGARHHCILPERHGDKHHLCACGEMDSVSQRSTL
jgi:hypothetical protein